MELDQGMDNTSLPTLFPLGSKILIHKMTAKQMKDTTQTLTKHTNSKFTGFPCVILVLYIQFQIINFTLRLMMSDS